MRLEDISRLGPAAQRQIRAKLGQPETKDRPPQPKFRNIPTPVNMGEGKTYTFGSRKEAKRFAELQVLLRAGSIRRLKLQPQFTLQESYIEPNGERVRAIRYVADFSYEKEVPTTQGARWELVVEDTKSRPTKTPQYEIKRKMMAERFGIAITEI